MNKLCLLGSCQQVVMINLLSAIKSHVKEPNVPIVSKYSRKNHPLLTVPFTLVLYSQQFFSTSFESQALR